ncbi:hypothetical protein K438DRAFT_780594 [Mycena galopus ATCC 62051]|nr:hypothetical protein K438DRAFT_780594 [Mycena galopus ATCC 62051]
MASSSSPPQLQLSLPVSSFKRSFEQFDVGYVESPSTIIQSNEQPIDGTGSTASSSSTTTSPDGDENRRKRARSASTLHEAEDRSSDASSSTLSSFDSDASDSFSQSSSSQAPRHHLLLDLGLGRTLGSSVALGLGIAASELQLGGRATSEPPPRIPTPELLESEDVDMPDIDIGFSIDENHDDQEEPTSPADNVRRSVDRFNAFDRHISVLRSSSPPVIPLPTSLSSHHASLSPPTLPPLPLVDLGLDPEDDEDGDEPEHIPSTIPTNMSTSTPPRLDLNLPPTTSLSSGPSSPHVATDEAPTQFRERLDSALTGIGGGVLHFEAPISPTDERVDGPSFDRYLEPAQQALASTSAGSSSNPGGSGSASPYYPRPFAESPLFEWTVPHALDWDTPTFSARSPGGSASADATRLPPSPWRRHRNNSNDNTTTTPDTTVADLRRLLGTPLPSRLLPRPPSLAAPATTTSSLDAVGLDVDLDDAYLDLRMPPNARAWESAVDRARTLHQQRERGRERERREREERQRVHERERQIAREREEETERERENPWRLDSIWGTNAGVESFPSARPRPRESSLTRMRRELAEDELALEITRRRAVERQLRQTLDRDRILDRRLEDEQPERGQSVSRAARYLESGLVDPREAPSAPSSNLRPPLDTSNPFSVSWTSRRAARPVADDASASTSRIRQSRSSSQSREGPTDWLGRMERDELSPDFDLLDEWLSEHPPPRSVTPAAGPSRSSAYDELEASDFPRRNPEGSSASSGDLWRSRATGTWQPRLALSPQSTAQPTRTATHARAQSIPSSSLSSATAQPSLHRLRQRLHEQPREGGADRVDGAPESHHEHGHRPL